MRARLLTKQGRLLRRSNDNDGGVEGMCLEEEGLRGEREERGGCGVSYVRKKSPKVCSDEGRGRGEGEVEGCPEVAHPLRRAESIVSRAAAQTANQTGTESEGREGYWRSQREGRVRRIGGMPAATTVSRMARAQGHVQKV